MYQLTKCCHNVHGIQFKQDNMTTVKKTVIIKYSELNTKKKTYIISEYNICSPIVE